MVGSTIYSVPIIDVGDIEWSSIEDGTYFGAYEEGLVKVKVTVQMLNIRYQISSLISMKMDWELRQKLHLQNRKERFIMKIAVLDAMEDENTLSKTLNQLLMRNEETSWFKVKDYRIQPCRSCGACSFKSPGRCVLKDDFEGIVKELAKSDILVFLTPIRFGGYASELKKVIDRFCVLGLPLYVVKDGHMLHPMRYDIKGVFGIGLSQNGNAEQEESFIKLVESNALNLGVFHKALTFRSINEDKQISPILADCFKEVLA